MAISVCRDRGIEVKSLFDVRSRGQIQMLASAAVIGEHAASSDRGYTPALEKLLRILRTPPFNRRLAIFCKGPGEYFICRTPPARGEQVEIETDSCSTVGEAVHSVFLRRLAEVDLP